MKRLIIAALTVAATGTLVSAHADETNPVIKARMEAMKTIGASSKVLGQMAKGQTEFDAAKAHEAAAAMSAAAAEVPALFEAQEMSDTTAALPAIWENYDDFTKISEELRVAADAATKVSAQADLGPALGAIGATCKSCHQDYRAKK